MADYTLNVIPVSALSFSGGQPWTNGSSNTGGGGGEGWQYGSYTFSYSSAAIVPVDVLDTEPDPEGDGKSLSDDPGNPEWTGGNWVRHSQTLETPLTINGTTYPAGHVIEDEYELNVVADGVTYRLVAIAISNPATLSFQVVGYTFDGAWPPEGAVLTSVIGSNQDGQQMGPVVPCFCTGTRIATPGGTRRVEQLQLGDLVQTSDGRAVPVLWIGRREVSAAVMAAQPALRPIRVAAGALGHGLPHRDLLLSPQHRVLLRSPVVARKAEQGPEALVAVKHLLGLPGITVDQAATGTTCFHLLTARHEVILAEAAEAETLLPGKQALRSLDPDGYREVTSLFPELAFGQKLDPARPILPGKLARHVAQAHRRHNRPLVVPAQPDQRQLALA